MRPTLMLLGGATALAQSTSSLYSQIDSFGMLKSIYQYSTPGSWSLSDYAVTEANLIKPLWGNLNPNIPKASNTPATAACTIQNPYNAATIANIMKTCNDVLVNNVTVPPQQTLTLSASIPNTVITFKGHTSWEFYAANYNLLVFSGTNLTVQGSPGHVIDGNGSQWWDGQGSNGGVAKPDHFITIKNVPGYSIFKNLYVKNPPTHNFAISGVNQMYAFGNVIDVLDGNVILPNGLPAAHNTDGWDMSTTTNSIFTNNVVFNEDDCVALTSGVNVNINNYFCSGGHGLSIGSVGGKSNNTVDSITFSNSVVVNSQNGCRIKTNSGTTGSINAVTYENIALSQVSIYGIDVQQDYLNGGPTGVPTPGVNITNIVMKNVQGSVVKGTGAYDYYILLATPSSNASTWTFENVNIYGAGQSSCDSNPPGFACAGY